MCDQQNNLSSQQPGHYFRNIYGSFSKDMLPLHYIQI